tara:strand:- start:5137 stop:5358 length:222 start_codon:yes stop_codon:yes gene_type:complete
MNTEQILDVLVKAAEDLDSVTKVQLLDAAYAALEVSTYTKEKCAAQVAESKKTVDDLYKVLHGYRDSYVKGYY